MLKKKKLIHFILLALISGFFSFLTVKALDTTQALNLLSDVEQAIDNETDYELGSYNEFFSVISDLGGVDAITAKINDPLSTQQEIDDLSEDMTRALGYLTKRTTYFRVSNLYDSLNQIDLSIYTNNSVTMFLIELERIEMLLANPKSGEQVILQAEIDLSNIESLLVLRADKTNLVILNNQAIIAYYEQRQNYTEESYSMFKAAVDNYGNYLYVNSVIADENVEISVVENIEEKISNAINLLVERVDNTQLVMLYNQLKGLNLDDFTDNSQTLYFEELERIFLLIGSPNLDESLFNQLLTDLNNSTDILVLMADFSDLTRLYNDSLNYNETDYSASSYSYYLHAIDNAYQIINDKNTTQSQVDDAIEMLNDALISLRPPIRTIYLKIGDNLNVLDYLVTKNLSIIEYSIDNDTAVSIDNDGMIKALQYGDVYLTVSFSDNVEETLHIKVKANISITTLILSLSLPIVVIGLGFMVVFVKKEDFLNLLIKMKNMFSKRKN